MSSQIAATDQVVQALLSYRDATRTPNPYAGERVDKTCDYPAGWTVPTREEQRERTASLFPKLVLPDVAADRDIAVPDGWDGVWCFPPKIAAIGRVCEATHPYTVDYGELVVEHVLGLVRRRRSFYNHRDGEMTANQLRINRVVCFLVQAMEAATPGDFLPPMPITLGKFYGGFSPRNAYQTAIRCRQLPFGTAQIGCLLAIMPERFRNYMDIWVDAPSDEYRFPGYVDWDCAPSFDFRGYKLELRAGGAENAVGDCGSAVGLPGRELWELIV